MFPRHFALELRDIKGSKERDQQDIIWQGEVFSEGPTQDMSVVLPYMIEEICTKIGTTVTNEKFRVRMR
jgi:hypothetical protein